MWELNKKVKTNKLIEGVKSTVIHPGDVSVVLLRNFWEDREE